MAMLSLAGRNKSLILASFGTFLLGTIVAIFSLYHFSDTPNTTYTNEMFTPGNDHLTTIILIQRNGLVLLYLLFGSLFLGSITVLNLFTNGMIFGAATASAFQYYSITKALALIIPHAIFELPAIWIAGAAGFKIPCELIRYITNKKEYFLNRNEIKDFLLLTGTAFALVIIAAFIEVNVTQKIAEILFA
ncbi:stage II sporulation protein M [uncultured Methanomethylovorans sp.]|uniref:stage II sporulation protein M n=1 Tax=uncultured Methanomethylovorans sp. TaxID=183759 RepID=UPI00374A58A4